jgi:ATP-binding cassette, subfamily B, bacterial PglK
MTDVLAVVRECVALLPRETRWRWIAVVPLTIAAAAAETAGAASVFAMIRIIGDPRDIATLPVVSTLYGLLPPLAPERVIVSFAAFVVVLYLAKNVLLGFVTYAQTKVVRDTVALVSSRILEGYFALPYSFHLRHHSATLLHKATVAAERVFVDVLAAAVSLATEALVAVGITAILMIASPVVTLTCALSLGILLTAIVGRTRRASTRWGRERFGLEEAVLRDVQQSLAALKEIKVLGRERYFEEVYARKQNALARIRGKHEVLTFIPRLVVESAFIAGILLVVLIVVLGGADRRDIVPLLGLFAYAGFRIIPSANRTLMHLTNLRHGSAYVEALREDFAMFDVARSEANASSGTAPRPFHDEIVFDGVSYSYEESDGAALRGIDLRVRRGESVGIVGPTGAGKSTLVNLVLGIVKPTAGRILVDGEDMFADVRAWRRNLGYVSQEFTLVDDTIRRNIAFGIPDERIDERRVEDVVRAAHLDEFVASLPERLDTLVGERGIRLSGGERQRVAIARALYHDPPVLVFDEATSSLDGQTERDVVRAIETLRETKTLVIVAHRASMVRRCDRITLLSEGAVDDAGTFEELLERSAHFRAMFLPVVSDQLSVVSTDHEKLTPDSS